MKTNIQALMNLISEMEKNLNNLTYVIDGYAINTSVQELDGKINIIAGGYSTSWNSIV